MTGRPRVFRGIGASPGVAIGTVFLLDRTRIRTPRHHIAEDRADDEVGRLRAAIDLSIDQLEAIRSRFVGDGMDHQSILEAHEMMLRDPSLLQEATALIRDDQLNAEWAVTRVINRVRDLLDRETDAYMRERSGDLNFVGDRIIRNLCGRQVDLSELKSLDHDTVVVAHDLSPADTAVLSRQRVSAFVTEIGGKTSHTSIVARSLDVPAVVGAKGIFDAVGTGDVIVVDGLDGTVAVRPTSGQLARGHQRAERFRRASLDLLEAKALPARTLDGFDVLVAGNIELPSEVSTVVGRGGEAIGLYRTEFMFLGRSTAPDEEEHFRTYRRLFEQVGDRPVTVRTLDIGGDKIIASLHLGVEPNPALGMRAIRYCLQNRPVFEAQLAGLLRAADRANLRIMLPMVSGIEELRAAREVLSDVQDRLRREGKKYRADVPFGIMIEVPSAVMTADVLAREADFFSVGTNDLMQYLLAIDRTNERVAYLYHPLHPAMLITLQAVTNAARRADIPCTICGEMAGETDYTAILLGLGFDQLSMNAGSIPKVKRLIRELNRVECVELLQESLECNTCAEVEELVEQFMITRAESFARSHRDPAD